MITARRFTMKKQYEKPNAEQIRFAIRDELMVGDEGTITQPGGSGTISGDRPGWLDTGYSQEDGTYTLP